MIGDLPIKTLITGIRPGEKIHEILVSEEEATRTTDRGNYYVISPILPELCKKELKEDVLGHEYSSSDNLLSCQAVKELLISHNLMIKSSFDLNSELIR